MMPASPPPAPNPFRGTPRPAPAPIPVLWLGRSTGPVIPTIAKSWIN